MMRLSPLLRFLAASLLVGLCSALLALGASADPGGNGSTPIRPPNTSSSSPGDEVTSLPLTAPAGTTLIGSPRALRALVLQVDGRGTLTFERLAPGQLAATFSGNFRLTLDRDVLASGAVAVVFRGHADERGRLSLAGGAPQAVDSERLPLPLPRLAESTLLGRVLELRSSGGGIATTVAVQAERRSLTLVQVMR